MACFLWIVKVIYKELGIGRGRINVTPLQNQKKSDVFIPSRNCCTVISSEVCESKFFIFESKSKMVDILNSNPNPYNHVNPNSTQIQTKYQILNPKPNQIAPAKSESELNMISLFKSNQITNIGFRIFMKFSNPNVVNVYLLNSFS